MDDRAVSIGRQLEDLIAILRELRAKCPWDREQTLAALGKHLIEEAYEANDAINSNEATAIADELGDLLAQSIFASIVAEHEHHLTLPEIAAQAAVKLVRRHPHVYGDAEASSAGEVVANWNRIKEEERRAVGASSALDGVARGLPALMRAEKLGARARDAGMDWADIHAVLAKVREEMDEVEGALARNDTEAAAEELGDMLLALANAPRFIGHSSEEVLRRSCDKFSDRFRRVETLVSAQNLKLRELSSAKIDELWQAVKQHHAEARKSGPR
jgi:ATP diphosphatase